MSRFASRLRRAIQQTSNSEGTIFGFNSSQTDPDRVLKMNWWGRQPCGRQYYGPSSLPSDGNGFLPGGREYKCAGLDVAGVVSSRRVNSCFKFDPATITTTSSPKAVEVYNYVRSIPAGWRIYLTYHEYNPEIVKGVYTAADFRRAFQILAARAWDATQLNKQEGKGEGIFVINIAGSGLAGSSWDDSYAPAASTMPPNCQFWSDAYDNPRGVPSNYKGYGTTYGNIGPVILDDVYDTAERLGYLDNSDGGTRGWGIGEFCSPRRVAPALASLNTTLGWGPLSPNDISGAGQAQAITNYANYCLGTPARPIPAKVVLLWTISSGNNWNQAFTSAGAPEWDAWVNGSSVLQDTDITDFTGLTPHPTLNQNWPITVDETLPVAAYQTFIDMSA